ncbi:hypothetical protein GJ207_19715 [Vibrio parahaemolyticus]|nr:hypothetical protein [Vibrio parahaemolyticus]HAS6587745.1 hypothetical protein [Vibrio parahaemolyticus]
MCLYVLVLSFLRFSDQDLPFEYPNLFVFKSAMHFMLNVCVVI